MSCTFTVMRAGADEQKEKHAAKHAEKKKKKVQALWRAKMKKHGGALLWYQTKHNSYWQ